MEKHFTLSCTGPDCFSLCLITFKVIEIPYKVSKYFIHVRSHLLIVTKYNLPITEHVYVQFYFMPYCYNRQYKVAYSWTSLIRSHRDSVKYFELLRLRITGKLDQKNPFEILNSLHQRCLYQLCSAVSVNCISAEQNTTRLRNRSWWHS